MVVNYSELDELADQKLIFVIGTFDILHPGHIHFLQKAKEVALDHKLVVAIIPDKIVRELKGSGRPVNDEVDRAEMVDSLKMVDYTFVAPEKRIGEIARETISLLKPEYSVASKEDWENKTEDWQVEGTKLVLIDKIVGRSTTRIVEKIRE